MGLLSKLKAVLGIDEPPRRTTRDTTVPVEREPETGASSRETARSRSEPASSRKSESGRSSATSAPDRSGRDTGGAEPAKDVPGRETARSEAAGEPLESIKGIGPAYSERLEEAGISDTAALAAADAAALADETGIPEGRLQEWIGRAGTP